MPRLAAESSVDRARIAARATNARRPIVQALRRYRRERQFARRTFKVDHSEMIMRVMHTLRTCLTPNVCLLIETTNGSLFARIDRLAARLPGMFAVHCFPLAQFARFGALAARLRSLVRRRCRRSRGKLAVCVRYDPRAALLWCSVLERAKFALVSEVGVRVRQLLAAKKQ
jgi:hypothetical protein